MLFFGKHYSKASKGFLDKVYEGFSVISTNECQNFNNMIVQDRVGNIIDGRLVVQVVNNPRTLFEVCDNKTLFGIESLVGRYKLQVFDSILTKTEDTGKFMYDGEDIEELMNTKTIFKGLVIVIHEPDNLSGDALINLLDEYTLKKQNGKLVSYGNMSGLFYTNTFKCSNKCIIKFDGLSVEYGSREECWKGCVAVNEVVALLRNCV